MKKLTIVILLLLSFNICAQWTKTNLPYESTTVEFNSMQILICDSTLLAFSYSEHSGLLRSTDYGLTWIRPKSGLLNNYSITKIYPFGSLLLANCQDSSKREIGYYRSTDNGDTWQIINTVFNLEPFNTNMVRDKNNDILGFSRNYNYKSTDNGITWIEKEVNHSVNFYSLINCEDYLVAVGYAFGDGAEGGIGVYFSNNEGDTWSKRTSGLAINPTTSETIVSVVTSINKTIFVGTDDGVYKTTDFGMHWVPSNIGIKGQGIYKLFGTNNKLIANNFESTDQGITWKELNINQTPDGVSNYLYYNYINYYLGISTDSGITWNYTYSKFRQKQLSRINYITVNGKNIFTTMSSGNIFTSSNYGNDWLPINLTQWNVGYYLTPTTKSFTLGHLSFVTHDDGKSWASGSFPQIWYVDHARGIQYGNWCYAVCGENEIAGSTGPSNIVPGYLLSQVYYLEVKEPFVFAVSNYGISKSTDCGLNWKIVFDSLHANYGDKIIVESNYVFACTNTNSLSWISKDNGSTWRQYSIMINNIIDISGNDEFIFVATSVNELWKKPIKEILTDVQTTHSLPSDYKLEQNYPNPFNPSTTIEYQLPTPGFVTLKVYNLLGREVATLIDEYKQAGFYNYKFSIINYKLSSGVYFYRLQAGSFSETKKLILMK